MLEHLDFGARAFYIWSAYGVAFSTLFFLTLWVFWREANYKRKSDRLRDKKKS